MTDTHVMGVGDQFAFWRSCLAAKAAGTELPTATADQPEAGYWRNLRKGQQAESVVYWRDSHDGALRCQVNGVDVEEKRALDLWQFVPKHPITEEWYEQFATTGKWPDMDDRVAAILPNPRAKAGDNSGDTDAAVKLRDQVDACRVGIEEYATITTAEQAQRAQTLRARLNELKREAEGNLTAARKPLIEQSRAIGEKWNPIIQDAEQASLMLRKSCGAFFDEQDRIAAAAARKAQEKAQAKAEKTGKPVEVKPTPAPPPEKTKLKGAYGRAAHVGMVKVVEITDQDQVYAFFRDNGDLKGLLQKLSEKTVRAGATVPGTSVTEKRGLK